MTSIHFQDQARLDQLHKTFQTSAWYTSLSTAAASFLVLGALIVITGACLCLTLPGVNVISDIVLPGILPGIGALALSTPFILYAFRKAREKNRDRRELIDWNIMLLNHHKVDQLKEEEAISFISKNLIKKECAKEYSVKILGDIKERYPPKEKDQTPSQKSLLKALDEAKSKIYE